MLLLRRRREGSLLLLKTSLLLDWRRGEAPLLLCLGGVALLHRGLYRALRSAAFKTPT